MTTNIISVDKLSKSYLIRHQSAGHGKYSSLRDVVGIQAKKFVLKALDVCRGIRKVQQNDVEEFWALKDVSFEIGEGEVVGIIGRNGAGKSTLLKVLSRITEPTAGRVKLRGRVASLLEVGTGFHPELTGRENVYLNGAILGMSRAEIKSKFDAIVDFAGVEKFLDTPVKHYSSGMYVRLAFAVAAHLEPDILVVDEVLAVGDAEFQEKCLGKIKDVSTGGRTVLFVSHNMGIVRGLCSRAIFMAGGQVMDNGPTVDVIVKYLSNGISESRYTRNVRCSSAIYLQSATVTIEESENFTTMKTEFVIQSTLEKSISIDMRVLDSMGGTVGFAPVGSLNRNEEIIISPGENRVNASHDVTSLANGKYHISIDLAEPTICFLDRIEDALSFEIQSPPRRGDYRRLLQEWGYGNVTLSLSQPKPNCCQAPSNSTPLEK